MELDSASATVAVVALISSVAAESDSAESLAAKRGKARGGTQKERTRSARIEVDRTLIAKEERGFGGGG